MTTRTDAPADTDTVDTTDLSPTQRAHWERLEQRAKRAEEERDAAQAENETYRAASLDSVFTKAGLKVGEDGDPFANLLRENYDGEPTVEAVVAAATAKGWRPPANAKPDPDKAIDPAPDGQAIIDAARDLSESVEPPEGHLAKIQALERKAIAFEEAGEFDKAKPIRDQLVTLKSEWVESGEVKTPGQPSSS